MSGRISELRPRLLLAALLAACAAALLVLDAVPAGGERGILPERTGSGGETEDIARVVDSLLTQYGIRSGWIRTWQVQIPKRGFHRVERRVLVPPEFISLDFNHDLNRVITGLGARAIATERTRETTVTVHIVREKLVIYSIAFVVDRTKSATRRP